MFWSPRGRRAGPSIIETIQPASFCSQQPCSKQLGSGTLCDCTRGRSHRRRDRRGSPILGGKGFVSQKGYGRARAVRQGRGPHLRAPEPEQKGTTATWARGLRSRDSGPEIRTWLGGKQTMSRARGLQGGFFQQKHTTEEPTPKTGSTDKGIRPTTLKTTENQGSGRGLRGFCITALTVIANARRAV